MKTIIRIYLAALAALIVLCMYSMLRASMWLMGDQL